MNQILEISSFKSNFSVYTKPEIVNFMLDIIKYSGEDLCFYRILEPSFGSGNFLFPIVDRLIQSAIKKSIPAIELKDCIRAVELDENIFYEVKSKLSRILITFFSENDVALLLDNWLILGDFLSKDNLGLFHFIVGNPPYIRNEALDSQLIKVYQEKFQTFKTRADIYISFFEHTLAMLADEHSKHAFICSNRWMKNKFGSGLRTLICTKYNLSMYMDLSQQNPFLSDVSAYSAITIIEKNKQSDINVLINPSIEYKYLKLLIDDYFTDSKIWKKTLGNLEGGKPFLLEKVILIDVLDYLEENFPILEDVGCKVGIGVATGADKVYIGQKSTFNVEEERLIPLAMTKSIKNHKLCWNDTWILNPFNNDGSLVDFDKYPKFKKYIQDNELIIRNRYVAKKNPNKWYKTIDVINSSLLKEKKLLIPDIKGKFEVCLDNGTVYPHHNLYYITSENWDLRALKVFLLSIVGHLFIDMYSIKMRGQYLRFQAQYLRRIRIPIWIDLSIDTQNQLIEVSETHDVNLYDELIFQVLKLNGNLSQTLRNYRKDLL